MYDGSMKDKEMLVAVNKKDRHPEAFEHNLARIKAHTDLPVFPISALEGDGLEDLIVEMKARHDGVTKEELLKQLGAFTRVVK